MKLEQILHTIQRGGDLLDRVRNTLDSHLHVESTGTKKQITWQLDPDREVAHAHFRDQDQEMAFRVTSGEHSVLEIWEEEGKRGLTLRSPKSISWEMNTDRSDQIANVKAAGIACAAGATLGFLVWAVLVVSGKLMESSSEVSNAIEEH